MCVSVLFMSPLCFVFLLVTYIPAIFERDLFISHLVFKLNSVNSLSIISCCLSVPIHSLSFRRIIKKWTIPGLFFVYFCLFKQTITFSQQIIVKNAHPVYGPGIQTPNLWNMSLPPQPLDQGSRPSSALLSLLEYFFSFVLSDIVCSFQMSVVALLSFRTKNALKVQCDQIGRFFKKLLVSNFLRSSETIGLLFGLF